MDRKLAISKLCSARVDAMQRAKYAAADGKYYSINERPRAQDEFYS